jgi:hypothetical protein
MVAEVGCFHWCAMSDFVAAGYNLTICPLLGRSPHSLRSLSARYGLGGG